LNEEKVEEYVVNKCFEQQPIDFHIYDSIVEDCLSSSIEGKNHDSKSIFKQNPDKLLFLNIKNELEDVMKNSKRFKFKY
jgi:hypothetical protein